MTYLDLSISNPAFAKLQVTKAPEGKRRLAIKSNDLPAAFRAELSAKLSAILALDIDSLAEDDALFTATFDEDGDFRRLYGPAVYADANEQGEPCLVIRLGSKVLPLTIDKDKVTYAEAPDADFAIEKVKFGKYDEVCLKAMTYDEETEEVQSLHLPLAITRTEGEEFQLDTFLMQLKKGKVDKALSSLRSAKAGTGGGGNSDPVLDVRTMPQHVPLTVIDYKQVKVSYGQQYILTLTNVPGYEGNIKVWSHRKLNQQLDAGANPINGSFTYWQEAWGNEGKIAHRFDTNFKWPEGDLGLKLDW